MVKLKKYNLKGEQVGEVAIADEALDITANSQMIKDYIVALRNNARQWSASTKGRREVEHTTKKPHPQKGQGRSRQGTLVAPQHRGGGVYGGPKPKFDQGVRINRKERRLAIQALLAEKMKANGVCVIADLSMSKPQTKAVAGFLDKCGFRRRVLFLGEFRPAEKEGGLSGFEMPAEGQEAFVKSVRNIPHAEFMLAKNASGYDLLVAHQIVITESALKQMSWLNESKAQ